MKTKSEFNLSEKIEEIQNQYPEATSEQMDMIDKVKEDVKEFIRLLLDTNEGMDENWIQKSTIIKIAGKSLT